LILGTDLEPDDMLAILHLKLRNVQPSAIIVGEGDVDVKVRRARLYARLLGWQTTEVIPGIGSEKPFPGDGADLTLDCVRDHVVDKPETSPDPEPSPTPTTWAVKFRELVNNPNVAPVERFETPTILYLKPPRELVAAEMEDPAITAKVFAKSTLVMYGSFNWREVGYSAILHWLNPGSTPFHRVRWFENFKGMNAECKTFTRENMSYLYGSDNSPPHAPLPDPESPLGLYCLCFREVARLWDAFVLEDCLSTCAAIEKDENWAKDKAAAERHHRNMSCFNSVKPHAGAQVAAADPVLVAALCSGGHLHAHYKAVASVTVPADSSYPVVEFESDDADSKWDPKVAKICSLDVDEMKWELMPAFRAAFGILPKK
jgi:hypothetical protein